MGRSFVEYGAVAARAALADAGLQWRDIGSIVGADTVRGGYPGYVAGDVREGARLAGGPGCERVRSVRVRAQAINTARAQILSGLADVVLVVGADAAPKGFFRPAGGDRPDDPDWLRFRFSARPIRRTSGCTRVGGWPCTGHTGGLRAGQGEERRSGRAQPYARYRKPVTAEEVAASAVVADPLRLLDICATSDGGAALVLAGHGVRTSARVSDPVRIRAVSTVTPRYPNTVLDLPDIATDSAVAVQPAAETFRESIARAAYQEAGIGPDDLSFAEVYDLSTALELQWYEDLGLCGQGDAAKLLQEGSTSLGGRIPVNASGGLASFGEAVPAQAIAQVCELTCQLRGVAGDRQVTGARVGIAANQGLFGHGSAVVAVR
ncbi:lipid-transfer protein [Streptomyces sp. MS1.AVA.1]|uniref:Lipid-transfer protein n=1 Tax=Streptomyces machairae TaxID=3134109 RepID=A0ABU8UHU4_9ACTN